MSKNNFYVVWRGRKAGIYSSWEECRRQVEGYTGAQYKGFPSRQAAEAAYQASYDEYVGVHVSALSAERLAQIGRPVADSYCVDAACSGNPGVLEYRGVHTTSRKKLFYMGPFQNGTNNIGEFLAIVHALALFQQKGIGLPLYSDSETAMGWVRAGRCKTRLQQDDQNAGLFDLIRRAEKWLQSNDYSNPLLKWETEAWGEIPADFNRK